MTITKNENLKTRTPRRDAGPSCMGRERERERERNLIGLVMRTQQEKKTVDETHILWVSSYATFRL